MAFYNNYPNTFKPGKIGSLTIPNRIIMAPMGTGLTGPDLRLADDVIRLYEERAKGGTGMIITECNRVAPDVDPFPIVTPTPRLDLPDKLAKISQYAETVSEYGTVPGMMVSLGPGRQADAPKLKTPVAPSECPAQGDPSVTCRALTVDEIHRLVEETGRAAAFAMTAGIKYIEIHGHAGYLVDQFLSPEINKRTDEYGGNAENRFRIVKESIEAIKSATGGAIPVSLRISIDHKMEGGRTVEEGLEYCRMAEAAGADALHIDAGRYETIHWVFPPLYLGDSCMVDLAAIVKNEVNIPVIAVGNFQTIDEIEDALASGKCDFVALGRGLLAEPEFAKKAKEGRADEIRPCQRCNEKCVGRILCGLPIQCAVNPQCGRETYRMLTPAGKKKKVTVVGGGVAGMVSAITAAKRGHKVTILEKNDELGGLLGLAGSEEFKHHIRQYRDYLLRQVELADITVCTGCEADIDTIKKTEPEAVVIATGSDTFIPGLPGFVASDKIGTIREFEQKELPKDARIVIAGGGLIASEAALALQRKGYTDVTIVEMRSAIAADLTLINMIALVGELSVGPFKIMTSTTCKSVEGDTLVVTDAEGNDISLPFDYLLVAMGTKSVDPLNEAAVNEFPEVYLIGDCVKPGRISGAVHTGYSAGLQI